MEYTFLFNSDSDATFTLSVPIGRRVMFYGFTRFVQAFESVNPGNGLMDDWLYKFDENMSDEEQDRACSAVIGIKHGEELVGRTEWGGLRFGLWQLAWMSWCTYSRLARVLLVVDQ